jgi:hypothetical protein
MKSKKGLNPFWSFIAVILGWGLFKDFDFTTYKFSEPYFDIVYFIVLVISIYFLIIDYRKQPGK